MMAKMVLIQYLFFVFSFLEGRRSAHSSFTKRE